LFELLGRRGRGGIGGAGRRAPIGRGARTALILLCAAAALAAAGVAHGAGTISPARQESNRIVGEAEVVIMEAGRSNPVSTSKLYDAVRMLEQATRIDPANDAAYVNLGFCYGLLRDANTAVEMYEKAAKLNPSPGNYKELANVYLRTGDPEHALMAANAGLSKDPANAPLLNAKGMALHDLTRFEEAVDAFKLALKYDPDFAVARANLESLSSRIEDKPASTAKTRKRSSN
jgi:tetratricopeptide (TPR) repeat protein